MDINKTKVYIAGTEPLEDESVFLQLYEMASPERKKKIDQYRYSKDKRLSLAAETLLKRALEQNGISEFELQADEYGKPFLVGHPSVQFNLSHSEERVMCVISGLEVGCDVEKVKATDYKIANRFFTESECAWLAGEQIDLNGEGNNYEEQKRSRFFRLWTLKESFMKAVGLGMRLSLKDFSFHVEQDQVCIKQGVNQEQYYFKEYDKNDGYKYAVCSLQPEIEDITEIFLNGRING